MKTILDWLFKRWGFCSKTKNRTSLSFWAS